MRKALAVGRKEFRQIVRDRRTLGILLLRAGVLPAAVTATRSTGTSATSRSPSTIAIDRRRAARWCRRSSTPATSISSPTSDSDAELTRLMDRNDARAVLVIPAGLRARTSRPADAVPVQVLLNGDNANTATTVMGYALTIVQSESARYGVADRIAGGRRSSSSRASGTTRSSGARCSSCPGLIAYIVDDHRGRLDGAVDRPGEGARHDGAGADGAARRAVVRRSARRFPYFVHLAGLGDRHRRSSRWCCSACRCAGRGCCCSPRCRCFWSARSASGC